MKVLNKLKKQVLIEAYNKIVLIAFPFMMVPLLKLYFGRKNIGRKCHIYSPLTLHNTNSKNLSIGSNVHIGRTVLLDLHNKININDNVTISMGCSLITHFNVGESNLKHLGYSSSCGEILIEENSYIGANTTILHGSKIGRQCVIGANSLVNKDIPDNSLAYGCPIKIIRKIQ